MSGTGTEAAQTAHGEVRLAPKFENIDSEETNRLKSKITVPSNATAVQLTLKVIDDV